MNRKLIALDLDGTALNPEGQLAPATIAILQKAQAAGHKVVLATGRPDSISEHFYDEIGLQGPMINFNGALIHIPHQTWSGEQSRTIPLATALSLLAYKKQFPVNLMIAEGKHLLRVDHAYTDVPFLPDRPHPTQFFDAQGLSQAPISVSLFIHDEQLPMLQKQLQADHPELIGKTWGAWSGDNNALEVTAGNASKSRALAYVAGYYHIPQEDVLAFGDDVNDLDMLQYAGVGVAMQNAVAPILQAADAVTARPNSEDGVADYLTSYLSL